jgi:hypothetical protein
MTMKSLLLLSGLILSLTACVPVNQSLEVHDVTLYGLQERHVFFYGKSAGDGPPMRDEIKIGETNIKISSALGLSPSTVHQILLVNPRLRCGHA